MMNRIEMRHSTDDGDTVAITVETGSGHIDTYLAAFRVYLAAVGFAAETIEEYLPMEEK